MFAHRSSGPDRSQRAAAGLLAAGLGLGLAACFTGAELEDKEPPAGHPGGLCLQGDTCEDGGVCSEGGACYDPDDPCKGFSCGGNGMCMIDGQDYFPYCECDPGYDNAQYLYYCTAIGE